MKVSGILMILLTLAGSFQALAQNRVAPNTMLEVSCIGYSTLRVAAVDGLVQNPGW